MSKVIFKMSFRHPNPNFKSKESSNEFYVEYIANKPEADKTLTKADLKFELKKEVELMETLENEDYLKYIKERPNSQGLFGQSGSENYKDVQKELSQVKSFLWRGIVSLKEEDAKNLGYLDKEKWQDMLRSKIPDMAKEMDIPITNLRWVAAVHMEKGHPHAHIMFWEKEPKRINGIVKSKTLDSIRKIFTDEIFEEERFQLLNVKNTMRDLLRDLAQNDVSNAAKLIKEIGNIGNEYNYILNSSDNIGVTPKLYSEQENELANMIKDLADKLPGKGRIALKFMPEEVKEEVRAIADYLLQQPELYVSLEKNLKSVEELTRLYTGQEEAINKAREKAYNDIRDRISQIILKGAAESQRENIFYVDQELSMKAIDFIKNMNNQINLVPEQTNVFYEVTRALTRAGYNSEHILYVLNKFAYENNINFNDVILKDVIQKTIESESGQTNIDTLSTNKRVDFFLTVLKLTDASEDEAFKLLKNIVHVESEVLDKQLNELKEIGLLKKQEGLYKLTNKGIEEILKIKELDRSEKFIMKHLEDAGKENREVDFNVLIKDKNIFSSLQDKDPEEFQISKFDAKIREEFLDVNRLTLKELETKFFEKYTDDKANTNIEKAEQEFDIFKNRIEKLTLNGYIELNKETGIYSFTTDSLNFFRYDDRRESYVLSDEAINKFHISKDMEFTRYDANVTLSYIDKANSGILTNDILKETLNSEITNQSAGMIYERLDSILDSSQTKQFISLDDLENLTLTKEALILGERLNWYVNKFNISKEPLTIDKLRHYCSSELEFINLTKQLDIDYKKGILIKNHDTGAYKIKETIFDVDTLIKQIQINGGILKRGLLKENLEKNIPNGEAEKQYKYIIWRLNNLKAQGYLEGENNEYKITAAGAEKRVELLHPERNVLKKTLTYLHRLGLIEKTVDDKYLLTNKYLKFMKDNIIAKENNIHRESEHFIKSIYELVEHTKDNINVGKIERTYEKAITGKYINGDYYNINTSYEDIRNLCSVPDAAIKTVNNLSTTLFVSGISLDDTKAILNTWNIKSNSNISPEKLNNAIDKAYKTVSENDLWGRTTVISTKDWNELFDTLGVDKDKRPQWIYKGENWQAFHYNMGFSIINDVWKSVWRELEGQRMQSEAYAENMKKQLNKQQAANMNKATIKEQIKKNKDRGSKGIDDDFEL